MVESRPIKIVQEALAATIDEFQAHPYAFLYEKDVQARLHAHLWSQLSLTPSLETAPRFRKVFCGPEQIVSHPVRAEWPLQVGRGRLDIALLATDQWRADKMPWNQRAWCAIEIKLWGDPKGDDYFDGFQSDLEKLRHYFEDVSLETYLGVALLFVHPHGERERNFITGLTDSASPKLRKAGPTELSPGVSGYVVTAEGSALGAPAVFRWNTEPGPALVVTGQKTGPTP